jgi:hypothetical protein
MFNNQFNKLIQKIRIFLFSEGHFENLGLMRFVLCGTLLYLAIFRQMNMDQFNGLSLIPRSDALNLYPDFYRPYFEYFFWPDQMAAIVHFGYIILLAAATLGLTNRFFLILTWIIAQGFVNRNYSMLFGADVIGTLFLFYLSFTNCSESFSLKNTIQNYLSKKSSVLKIHSSEKFSDQISTVFFRLIQIQICVIYMYTGFEKLKGNTWWDGTALWTVFANPQFTGFDLIWLKNFPLFFAVGTFVTVIFEIYFPAMILNKKLRNYWLWAGLFFHVLIGLTLSLMTFSFVMLSTYFLFIDRLDLRRWSSHRFLNFRK